MGIVDSLHIWIRNREIEERKEEAIWEAFCSEKEEGIKYGIIEIIMT